MLAREKELISIPYPLKNINWEKIVRKVKQNPNVDLEKVMGYGNQYPMKIPDINNVQVQNNVIEVTHAPTGCMLIKRSVFDKLKEAYPDKRY
jgi:hypothetical protein